MVSGTPVLHWLTMELAVRYRMVSYNRDLKYKDLQSGRCPATAQYLELSPAS